MNISLFLWNQKVLFVLAALCGILITGGVVWVRYAWIPELEDCAFVVLVLLVYGQALTVLAVKQLYHFLGRRHCES